jgi:hypothetical protein
LLKIRIMNATVTVTVTVEAKVWVKVERAILRSCQ